MNMLIITLIHKKQDKSLYKYWPKTDVYMYTVSVRKYASSEETPLPLQIHGAMRSVPP